MKQVVNRDPNPLHGDLREFADTLWEQDATMEVSVPPGEHALVFVVDGRVHVAEDGSGAELRAEETLLVPPAKEGRRLKMTALEPSRTLRAVTGEQFGTRRRGKPR